MRKTFGSEFTSVVKWARETTTERFRLRVVPGLRTGPRNSWGFLTQSTGAKMWTILIDASLHESIAIYTFLEEVAHMEDFAEHGYVVDDILQHRDSWARRYGYWVRGYYRLLRRQHEGQIQTTRCSE